MAIHPKITLGGIVIGVAVGVGLSLFLLGRLTVGANLGELMVGVGAGLAILGAVGIGLIRYLPGSSRMEGMTLPHSQPSEEGYVSALARADLVGKSGIAATDLRPGGLAVIEGERLHVISEGEWLAPGTPLTVVKADAMRLVVRRSLQLNA
ncbi:MAG TPA: NfeD family protein [Gemmatimonadales bacterium]